MKVVNFKILMAILGALCLLQGCATRTPLPPVPAPAQLGNLSATEPLLTSGETMTVGFIRSTHILASAYKISAGDILRIDVLGHPTLSRNHVVVLPDGYISLPTAGRLLAAGITINALTARLVSKYTSGNINKPDVVVAVQESQDPIDPLVRLVSRGERYAPLRFVVGTGGQLDLPFIGAVSVDTTFSEFRSEVKRRYLEMFGPRLQVIVESGESSPPVVYVIGEVVSPGPVAYIKPYSPLMAVAAAGGIMPTADYSDVRLFRMQKQNTYGNWSIDLARRLDHGEGENEFNLRPYDVVYVPRSGIAEANRVVEQYIRKMLPFNIGFGLTYQVNEVNQ